MILSFDIAFDTITSLSCHRIGSPPYTVTFAFDEGMLVEGDLVQIVGEGTSPSHPSPAKAFISWDARFDNVLSDLVIHAIWTRTYTVTFDGSGGAGE